MKTSEFIWKKEERTKYLYNSNDLDNYKRFYNINCKNLVEHILKIYNKDIKDKNTYAQVFSSFMSALFCFLLKYKDKRFKIYPDAYFETKEAVKCIGVTIDNENYDFVICEPLSNVLLEPLDIKYICEEAHSRGAKVIVDNSLLSCYKYNPFEDGADIVIESLSKYADGTGDTLGGVLIGEDLIDIYPHLGVLMLPNVAYQILRSFATMPLRIEKQIDNAQKLSKFLFTLTDKVRSNKNSGIVSCVLGDIDFQEKFIKNCKHCSLEDSFGQVNTLIGTVYLTFAKPPYDNGVIRISCGIEDAEEIIEDIKQAYTRTIEEISNKKS